MFGSHRGVRRAGAVLAVVLLAALAGVLLAGHSPSAAIRGSSTATRSATVRSAARNRSAARGGSSATTRSAARYGGLPRWLPRPTVPVGRLQHASGAHPVLAIQGDSVSVDLPSGHVLATVVGPEVPEEGRFPVPTTSACTFVLTFAHVSGAIPLNAAAFTLIDELGHVRHPRVTAMGGGPPPAWILPGRPLSLTLYDVLPTGNGSLAWSPAGGPPRGRSLVAWDFDVEID